MLAFRSGLLVYGLTPNNTDVCPYLSKGNTGSIGLVWNLLRCAPSLYWGKIISRVAIELQCWKDNVNSESMLRTAKWHMAGGRDQQENMAGDGSLHQMFCLHGNSKQCTGPEPFIWEEPPPKKKIPHGSYELTFTGNFSMQVTQELAWILQIVTDELVSVCTLGTVATPPLSDPWPDIHTLFQINKPKKVNSFTLTDNIHMIHIWVFTF